ncbi:hypothetical protein Hanom_Chr04g00321171 [Helianthus anomalus]
MFELGGAAYDSGRKDGYAESKAGAKEGIRDDRFELFKILLPTMPPSVVNLSSLNLVS